MSELKTEMVIAKQATAMVSRQVEELDQKITRIDSNLNSLARATNHEFERVSDERDAA